MTPMRPAPKTFRWPPILTAAALVVAAVLHGPDARSDDDPALRGLDAFVVAPSRAPSGSTVELLVRTYGYRTVDAPLPLGRARVELRADDAPADAPPIVVESADDGTARLALPIPPGDPGRLGFRLTLSHGTHARFRDLAIERTTSTEVGLVLADDHVRPGEVVTAWVDVQDAATGRPRPDAPVAVSLERGGASESRVETRTDAAGGAVVRLRVPRTFGPSQTLAITALALGGDASPTRRDLYLAERAPAQARLEVTAAAERVRPGAGLSFRILLQSAVGDAITGHPVEAVVLREGEEVPAGALGDARAPWGRVARRLTTDAAGVATVTLDAPRALAASTQYRVHARTSLEGRELARSSGPIEVVARGAGRLRLTPEAGVVVPGLRQDLILEARDGWGEPVAGGTFRLTGDGLAVDATTDARGLALVPWEAPLDVGSRRDRGPCAADVAATVRVRAVSGVPAEVAGTESTPTCLVIDRKQRALARPVRPVVRAGERAEVDLLVASDVAALGPDARAALVGLEQIPRPRDPVSAPVGQGWGALPLGPAGGARSARLGIATGPSGGALAPLHALVPRTDGPALDAAAHVLVVPALLPRVLARVASGRALPGEEIEIAVRLVDEGGAPVAGNVAAVVWDRSIFEPGAFERWASDFDTRLRLCGLVGVEPADCDAVLAGAPETLPLLRRAGADRLASARPLVLPADPGRSRKADLDEAFRGTLESLEGALFEAASEPGRLRDALRATPRGRAFHPELFEVVTQAMGRAPRTPGGEPFTLADLVRVDPQVDYDTVARRVARLKLFRLLVAARAFRHERDLDAAEPALRDPNALLRRWARSGRDGELLDPWGGRFTFVKAAGPPEPFLMAMPGFELRSPGPDGRLGNADDVRDPFERVVRSGSPYAAAMGEDEIVDARLDMRVADPSIAAWSSLLEEHTGTSLGGDGGFGSGSGRLGGAHRTRAPSIRMGATSVSGREPYAAWSPPTRVDAQGEARLRVRLGADETTYRVAVLGMPDAGGPAIGHVDVPVAVPLSVRVDAGEGWTVGDEVGVSLRVQNRTKGELDASVRVSATGGAALAQGESGQARVRVPAGATRRIPVRVAARFEGTAAIEATVSAPGHEDAIRHEVPVGPAGVIVERGRSRWIAGRASFDTFLGMPGHAPRGRPALVVDAPRALGSWLSPRFVDDATEAAALVEALEIYERVRRHAARPDGDPAEAKRAEELAGRAAVRVATALGREDAAQPSTVALVHRARRFLPPGFDASRLPEADACPSAASERLVSLLELEAEPPAQGAVAECWELLVARASGALGPSARLADRARAVLALAERPHRKALAEEVARALARSVAVTPAGRVTVPARTSRGDRALVLAALTAASATGLLEPGAPKPEAFAAWLAVERGADGSYGSLAATRAALTATLLLAEGPPPPAEVRVLVLDERGEPLGGEQRVPIGPRGARVDLDPRARRLAVASERGVLVRLEQRMLVDHPAAPSATEDAVEVRWPAAVAGGVGTVTVSVRLPPGDPRSAVVRLPLVPGARLADTVEGVTSLGDVLLATVEVDATGRSAPLVLPLRFALSGSFLAAPAEAALLGGDEGRARGGAARVLVAPAR